MPTIVQQSGATVIVMPANVVANIRAIQSTAIVAPSPGTRETITLSNVAVTERPVVTKIGGQGLQGPPGEGGNSTFSALAAQAIAAGQPVYIDLINGQLRLASAAALTTARVAGVASASIASGFVGAVDTQQLQLPDWTAVVGATTLQRGQPYYLGLSPGTLATTPPSSSGQVVAPVGKAVSSDTLELSISPTVLL